MGKANRKHKEKKWILIASTTIIIIIFLIIMPIITINAGISNNITDESPNDEIEENNEIKLESNLIKVYITETAQIEELNIEDYICGVVANEMPANFEEEALKAQAVAARTFLVNKINNKCPKANGADVCNSTHCQVYTSEEKRKAKWEKVKADEYWNKIKNAVDSTAGEILTYDGQVLQYPQYFSTSSGNTEDAIDVFSSNVPYLKSVVSSGEENAPKYISSKIISVENFINIINSNMENLNLTYSDINDDFIDVDRSNAGGIKEVDIGGNKIKGTDFRMLFGLNSTNFTYKVDGDNIVFTCKGYGHGVGMSQWGANAMAKLGSSYDEILKHYYTGIKINSIKYIN